MDNYQKQFEEKHLSVVNYFRKNKFGSQMAILTYLSNIKPIDRCIILEKIYKEQGSDIILLDKMLLAYVKVGRIDLAEEVINIAMENGESNFNIMGMKFKLGTGLPPDKTDEERLITLNHYLDKTDDNNEIEFLNLLINFISN